MKKTLLIFVMLMFTSINHLNAYPGYVSRDCVGARTKESITVDWIVAHHYFYTISRQKKIYNGKEKVVDYYSTWCKPGKICYQQGWRSHAGKIADFKNNYAAGVWGFHYWDNHYRKREESRKSYAIDCNLESWGYDNWDK